MKLLLFEVLIRWADDDSALDVKTRVLNSDYASGLRCQGTNIDLHQTQMKFKGCDVVSEEEEACR